MKISDFGLARAVNEPEHAAAIHGTPSYMSPEQSLGGKLDPRSDLFSLGSEHYTLAAGRPLFQSDSLQSLLRQIREAQPRRPGEVNPAIPAALETTILKLLAKRPEDRHTSADEVAAELRWQLVALHSGPTTSARRWHCAWLAGLVTSVAAACRRVRSNNG